MSLFRYFLGSPSSSNLKLESISRPDSGSLEDAKREIVDVNLHDVPAFLRHYQAKGWKEKKKNTKPAVKTLSSTSNGGANGVQQLVKGSPNPRPGSTADTRRRRRAKKQRIRRQNKKKAL